MVENESKSLRMSYGESSDRGGVGVDGEVKTQGGGRVRTIEGGRQWGGEAMWLCGSVRVI